MHDIVELERRITAAMERITQGVERLSQSQAAETPLAEIARLQEALDEERMTNAQLQERLRVLHDKDREAAAQVMSDIPAPDTSAAPNADADRDAAREIADLRSQLAEQDDEISTLRRVLAEAGKEIASLRAARSQEAAELGEILGALDPLIRAPHSETPHA